ncbi:MAG: SusC/RagA family TonB-linked outer membrane protein [Bacteroidales bacterium]|nr:SusC/RagA family TonB-linked outer membrane protein [Bacteroidales bacterium]
MNKQNNKQNKHLPMRLWTLLVSVLCFGSFAFAQTTVFTGKVVDETSSPMAGVNVTAKGTTAATITNFDGEYTLSVEAPAVLSFAFVGYDTETVAVLATNTVNNVTMHPTAPEMVEVAFRKLDSQDILGGIETLNVAEVIENNYFLGGLDNMQAYFSGFNGSSVWGFDSRLVVIDGVAGRDANNIKPDEIESITILKGAQAVLLYGSHAAKGAILITTKRGQQSDICIDARANTGWNVFKAYPEYTSAAEYMILYNQARKNDGDAETYSAEDIYLTNEGKNPTRYPDLNLYSSDYIKKAYNRWDVTAEIYGGSDRATYYSNVSYYRVGTPFKFGNAKNNYIDRLSARGNVDMFLGDIVTAFANATASFYNNKQANGSSDFWEMASQTRPNKIQPFIPIDMLDTSVPAVANYLATARRVNGKYILGGVTNQQETNTIADMYVGGESTFTSRVMQFDTGVKIDLEGLTKGLSLTAVYGLDYSTSYSVSMSDEYATFEPSWSKYNGKMLITGLTKGTKNDKHSGAKNIGGSTSNMIMSANVHFDYNRSFDDHNVNAIVLVNGDQRTVSGEYHSESEANFGAQVNYNFAHKYYANVGISMIHTARLAEENRNHLSKSIELGWDAAKESFLDGGIFNKLLISAALSQIKTDLNVEGFYPYASIIQKEGWWGYGDEAGGESNSVKQGENPDLDPQSRDEISVNLKAELLDRALKIDASFYTNKYKGGIIRATSKLPSYMSLGYPNTSFVYNMNYDEDKRTGFDASVRYNTKIGSVDLGVGVFGSYYTTEATKRDETTVEYDYQKRQGRDLDGNWGYECLGFFQSEEDIANSPSQTALSTNIKPGDLKYKDQNGDGVIDNKDQVFLSRGGWYGAPTTIGTNITAKYKGFTLLVIGTGDFGGTAYKSGSYWRPSGEQRYSAEQRNAWTPATASTATLPRLTATANGNNNQTSTFWEYKTNRFNIAKVQLTYDFASSLFEGTPIKGAQVYVSGFDLLTISKERKWMETTVNYMPQSRFYNLGVKVSF